MKRILRFAQAVTVYLLLFLMSTSFEKPSFTIPDVETDGTIPQDQLKQVFLLTQDQQLMKDIEQKMGMQYQKQAIVQITESESTYKTAMLKFQWNADTTKQFMENSSAIAFGNQVLIPFRNYPTTSRMTYALGHELTHVLMNQNGIGNELPSWMNEGLAWHNGLTAEYRQNSFMFHEVYTLDEASMETLAQKGQLLPLISKESDLVNQLAQHPVYNLEMEDWIAVEHLYQTNGQSAIMRYLTLLKQHDQHAFGDAFGKSETDFWREFQRWLLTSSKIDNQPNKNARLYLHFQAQRPIQVSITDQYQMKMGSEQVLQKGSQTLSVPVRSTPNSLVMIHLIPLNENDQTVTESGFQLTLIHGQYNLSGEWVKYADSSAIFLSPDQNELLGVTLSGISLK